MHRSSKLSAPRRRNETFTDRNRSISFGMFPATRRSSAARQRTGELSHCRRRFDLYSGEHAAPVLRREGQTLGDYDREGTAEILALVPDAAFANLAAEDCIDNAKAPLEKLNVRLEIFLERRSDLTC